MEESDFKYLSFFRSFEIQIAKATYGQKYGSAEESTVPRSLRSSKDDLQQVTKISCLQMGHQI